MQSVHRSTDAEEARALQARLESRGIKTAVACVDLRPTQDDGGAGARERAFEIVVEDAADLERARAEVAIFFEEAVRENPVKLKTDLESSLPAASPGLWIEVVVVGLVGCSWPLYSSIASFFWPPSVERFFWYETTARLANDLPIIALVLFIAHKSGASFSKLGLVRPRILSDFLGGAGLWVFDLGFFISLMLVVHPVLERLIPDRPELAPFLVLPTNGLELSFLVVTIVVGAFYEELIVRGYLITRLERLLSAWEAIVLTTIVFCLWHLYQGASGILGSACSGLVYGTAFCLTGRLWPVVVAHCLHNGYAVLMRALD